MSFRWDESQSGVPLTSLSATVLDTETTGFDTSNDRVVQIGAVKIVGGHLDEAVSFDCLVDPGIPIPEAASRIHGITDSDVSGAAGFGDAMSAFTSWSGEGLVVGYSVGFDLGVLQAEYRRSGLRWTAPRCLDVRHLLRLLVPSPNVESLEAAAAWLGIPVTDRHNALRDAMLTARLFVAVAPLLRDRGVSTLAQAEQACLDLPDRHEAESRAGWHEVASAKGAVPRSVSAYARIDSYPYRHRVRDVMRTPPIVVEPRERVLSANRSMLRENVSSVFVRSEDGGRADGIVTERDLLRALEASPEDLAGLEISGIASRPLLTVDRNELLYRAMSRMASSNVRHLGVTDGSGALVGVLSSRDLLYQRAADAVSLGDSVDQARNAEELGRIWADLTMVVRGLSAEEVDPRDIAAVISKELGELTRRACQIAERNMIERGRGEPPSAYAMLVLGSGGRGESLLAMDQDNAIVFGETADDLESARWFRELGGSVADILNAVGVSYCTGGVMAKNAEWCLSATRWRDTIGGWLRGAKPEHILNADIFFDGLPVHGTLELGDRVRQEGLELARRSTGFLHLMSMNAADFQVPVGMFGRLQRTDGRVDLKAGGILPIFSTARVLALKYGRAERSTPGRLKAVQEQVGIGGHVVANLVEAHRILMGLVLVQQLRDIEAGVKLSNGIDPAQLSSHQKQDLGWAFDQVRGIPDLVGLPKGLW